MRPTFSQEKIRIQELARLRRESPPSPPTLSSSVHEGEDNKQADDSDGSVPSEEANVELESYLPIVAIEEHSQEESLTGYPQTYSAFHSSMQSSQLYGARRGPRGSEQRHVGGWGGGPDHTKTVRASLPELFGGSYDNDRNISGQVDSIHDETRRSRFLDNRAQMVREGRISISVDRKSEQLGERSSFQDILKLGTEEPSRRSSLDPSRYSPQNSRRGSNFNISTIRKHSQGPPIRLQRQPTDNFSKVFFKAGIDPHLLQQRLLNASKADGDNPMKEQLSVVKESQNRVCLTAEADQLREGGRGRKPEKITSVEFMERVLTAEAIETLRSIFLKHSSVSDTRGESIMKLWQFRKFCCDFGLATNSKEVAEMEVLYHASTKDKHGRTHLMNLAAFLVVLVDMARKHYSWMSKEKAFTSLVQRYLMKNFLDHDSQKSLEFDVALREYFRAFKYSQLTPPFSPKILDSIYSLFCEKNLKGINVTGFQRLTRHLRINPVFCSDLQAKKVYKYLEQMKIEAGAILKRETLEVALYLLFLPAVESDAPFSKRWKFMVKWVSSSFQKLQRPIK